MTDQTPDPLPGARPEPRPRTDHEHLTSSFPTLPEHTIHEPLAAEPATRRIHQYGLMMALAVLVIVFAVWLVWSYQVKQDEAKQNAAAAHSLCRQLSHVGQPCVARVAGEQSGVSGDAAVPAPTAALTGSPLTTDENGVPQAYQPGEDALIVAVHVAEGRLILTYDDGARVDAGPVNEETLAIVLANDPTATPWPGPSLPGASSPGASPSGASPTPAPGATGFPPGADGPDPAETGAPSSDPATPQESPS